MRRLALISAGSLLAGTALAAHVILAAVPIGRMDLPWWRARFLAKQHDIADGRFGLIYYGDSITQNFERVGKTPDSDWPAVWQRFYGRYHPINLGFIGDTTASLLWRLDHGEGKVRGIDGPPRAAILLIGANNLGRPHWGAAETLAGIAADIDAIHHHLPDTHIILVSVLPADRGPWVAANTGAINAGLGARYGAGTVPYVTYVDVTSVFMRHGRVDDSLFIDPHLRPPGPPLHPNATAAADIAERVAPAVGRAMESKPDRSFLEKRTKKLL